MPLELVPAPQIQLWKIWRIRISVNKTLPSVRAWRAYAKRNEIMHNMAGRELDGAITARRAKTPPEGGALVVS
jgi:hypothetical protein